MNLEIEYIPIDQIKPYENNAKLHPAEQIEQIKKSIQQFDFNDPIAVWHGEIIEGHGRYLAAKELGMDKVPVIRLDSLTDEQRRAYMLVHNKLTMETGFDFDMLQEELKKLTIDLSDFDLDFYEEEADQVQEQDNKKHDDVMFTPDGVINGGTGYNDQYLPERYDDSDIQEYIDKQEEYVVKKRIIITYLQEQEQELATMLHVENINKVVYDIDEIFK